MLYGDIDNKASNPKRVHQLIDFLTDNRNIVYKLCEKIHFLNFESRKNASRIINLIIQKQQTHNNNNNYFINNSSIIHVLIYNFEKYGDLDAVAASIAGVCCRPVCVCVIFAQSHNFLKKNTHNFHKIHTKKKRKTKNKNT